MDFPQFDIFDIGGSIFKMLAYYCWSFVGTCCDVINELIGAIDNMSIFTLSFGSPELQNIWNVASSVCTNVSMVVAYSLLGFFVAVELYHATQHMSTSKFGGLEMVMRCIIKVMVVKLVIDNTPVIMRAVYDLTVNLTIGVQKYATGLSGNSALMPKEELQGVVAALTTDQVGVVVLLFLVMVVAVAVVFGATILVVVIALTRYIEIFLCVAFAALPLVCFASAETKSVGMGFAKNYLAVCLQGTILVLLIKFMVPLFSAVAVLIGNMVNAPEATGIESLVACVAPVALCVAMITTIQHTREFANRIVGAA